MLPIISSSTYQLLPRDPSLVCWYKGDQPLGPGVALPDDDSEISFLFDNSGNNNHLIKTANGPLFKTNVQNGLPVIRFSSEFLYILNSNALRNCSGKSCFLVAKSTNAGTDEFLFSASSGISTTARRFSMARVGGTYTAFGRRLDEDDNDGPEGGIVVDGSFVYNRSVHNHITNVATIYANGVLLNSYSGFSSVGLTSDTPSLTLSLGALYNGGFPFDGDIAELLLYRRPVSSEEEILIETYVKNKWGL